MTSVIFIAVLSDGHTCYPHCSDGETGPEPGEGLSEITLSVGEQAWTPCSLTAGKYHTFVGIGMSCL